jgi:putative flippase GtrA
MTHTGPHAFAGALGRYALVGAAATLTHYALLAAWVEWLQGAAWVGSGVGAALGAQVAFFGNRSFTFDHSGPIFLLTRQQSSEIKQHI